ncbi:MAG: hypothetical protein CVU84_11735 [Firmicutes bacterium HGW-Firmicutes-1]|jgi:hypothetical protein|nr:MAG: hypothetical protein CVU84_11735 [Firmicutes bacterium HGW-Firmicutes-1]
MKYELLATDLDGTLLTSEDYRITEENQEALKYARSKGVKIVICTGRSIKSTKQFIEAVEGYEVTDYFVGFNGSVVTNLNGDTIFRKPIQKEVLMGLIDIGRNEDVDVHVYNDTEIKVERYNDRIKEYEIHSATTAVLVDDLKKEEFSLKLLYNCGDNERLIRMKKKIQEKYKDEVFVFFTMPDYLEVLSSHANKGLALEYLAKHLGIDAEKVIAIGDNENDSYMIRYAGVGVCMKNGRESVQEIADYVTEKTNNESGVAEVIRKFV